VPVGCEQLPVTDGSFNEDNTKIKAPAIPSMGFVSGCSSIIFFNLHTPYATNGNAIAYQNTHHFKGKNPSIICMSATSS